jgi:hypothetical protein
MSQSVTSDALAHWHYTPDEWQDFVSCELKTQMKSYRSLKIGFTGIIVAAGLIMSLLVLIPFLMMGKYQTIWRGDVWGPVFGVAVLTGILLLVLGIYFQILKNKINRLKSLSGDVLITLNGVSIDGGWFNWKFGSTGWRFHNVRRKTIDLANGRKLEILEFKITALDPMNASNARGKVASERIPIPKGKEAEAENIINRLEAEKNRFAE